MKSLSVWRTSDLEVGSVNRTTVLDTERALAKPVTLPSNR